MKNSRGNWVLYRKGLIHSRYKTRADALNMRAIYAGQYGDRLSDYTIKYFEKW